MDQLSRGVNCTDMHWIAGLFMHRPTPASYSDCSGDYDRDNPSSSLMSFDAFATADYAKGLAKRNIFHWRFWREQAWDCEAVLRLLCV
jgi:hypothetical protein